MAKRLVDTYFPEIGFSEIESRHVLKLLEPFLEELLGDAISPGVDLE